MIFKYIYLAVQTDNGYQIVISKVIKQSDIQDCTNQFKYIYNEQFTKDAESLFPEN